MLEDVAQAIKSHLESDLESELDVVETYWSGKGDALTLPDPVTFLLGFDPDIVDYARSLLPAVISMAQVQGPSGKHESRGRVYAAQSDQWGFGGGQVVATVIWRVAADDTETAAKYGWRYGKAIHEVFKDHERLDTDIWQTNYVPAVTLDPPRREYPDAGSKFFTVMGQMEFVVEVRHE